MLDPARFAALSSFSPAPLLVTSFYATTDAKRNSRHAAVTQVKDLARARLAELKTSGLTHDQQKSLDGDFARLTDYLETHAFTHPAERGLAAFSCAGADFFQAFPLPHGFKTTLLVGPTPYLRPYNALVAQAPPSVVVLVDQHRARAFSFHGDESHNLFDVTHETGSRIRQGGFQGKDERHIEHHHDEAVHHHYQDVADRLLHAFQSAPFQYLALAGHLDELHKFERHLHSYVAERVVGRFRADVRAATRDEVRARTAELVTAEEKNRQQDAVQRLIGASRTNGGLAVTGLKNSLGALNDRRVQTLLVAAELRHPGRHCSACETLFETEPRCPRCEAPTVETADIVDEAIAMTVHQGGAIRILPPDSPLAAHGQIGAMLRY
ncbi:MAG: hypothetical protein HUU15_14245 [Candidatus Brocadiae bacterium]|nr:hypothetical protein [Candidatus Brocadiia bacterium]